MKDKKLMHFRYIFYPFLAFLFGIAIAKGLFAGNVLSIVLTCVLFAVYIVFIAFYKKWIGFALVLVFFMVGNGFFFLGSYMSTAQSYDSECIVVGRVTDNFRDYSSYDSASYYIVLEDVLINGEHAKNVYVNISAGKEDKLEPGDKLTFKANLQTARLFNLGQFNSFYYRNDIGYLASTDYSQCLVVSSYLTFDESLRLKVKDVLYSNMSENNASICYAVLFGDKSDIDYEVKGYYQNSGIIHVLTVSGLHVGFLIALIYFVLRLLRLKRLPTTIITSIILLAFNIVCGFTPSVMRASIMAVIMMLASLSGRQYDNLNALGLAGFIILLIKPLYAFDIGFLMSFSSVAAIFLLYRPISNIFKRVMPDKLAEYLALTFSAQIGILPFLSTFQTSVNLLSFFANLLIVPLFSFMYPLLMISIIFILIIPAIGKVLWIFDRGFDLSNIIAKFFASTSFQVPLLQFDLALTIFIFLILFLTSHFTIMKKAAKFISGSVMSLLLVVSVAVNFIPKAANTGFSTLNSGQMECLIATSESGNSIVTYTNLKQSYIMRNLKNAGIKNVDYVVLEDLPTEEEIDLWTGYNVKKIICPCEGGTSIILNAESGKPVNAGVFNIEYEQSGLGVKINFDDVSIFLASFSLNGYNEINSYLQNNFFDLVYVDGSILYNNQGYNQINCFELGNLEFSLEPGRSDYWRLD